MCSTFSFHVTSRRPEAAIDWARSAIARCPASFGNSRALISLFARGRRQVFVAAAADPIRASAIPILLGLGRTAGAAGFFTFQQSARPERYGDPSRCDTMPSQPGAQACLYMIAPSTVYCSLKTTPSSGRRSSLSGNCVAVYSRRPRSYDPSRVSGRSAEI